MEILEAFDLTGSLRAASELVGCSPNTVARHVRLRARGRPLDEPVRRNRLIDPHLRNVEEWVERSHGKVRADVVHDKLTSNLHPARFDTIFPKGLATAAVDRLLNHAHVIVTEGRSHRLSEALDGRGVEPLQTAET